MTAPREMWANEQEAAELCGRSYPWFVRNRAALEAKGFPKRHPVIRKRPVSDIMAYLGLAESVASDPPDPPNSGNWG